MPRKRISPPSAACEVRDKHSKVEKATSGSCEFSQRQGYDIKRANGVAHSLSPRTRVARVHTAKASQAASKRGRK